MRRRAFTLVELLVVVGIISVLLALLMPAIRKARRQADQVLCLNNLRQIGAELVRYINHVNHGRFPTAPFNRVRAPEASWVDWSAVGNHRGEDNLGDWDSFPETVRLLDREIPTRIMLCPTDPLNRFDVYGTYPFSYRIHRWAIDTRPRVSDQNAVSLKLTAIRNPGQKVVMIDTAAPFGDPWGQWHPRCPPFDNTFKTVLSVRHHKRDEEHDNPLAGYGNVLFADFHCDYVSREMTTDPRHHDLLSP